MSSRKKVILAIALLEKKLWSQQNQVNLHKRYFNELFNDNLWAICVLLLPAFLVGWHSRRIISGGKKLHKFGRLATSGLRFFL